MTVRSPITLPGSSQARTHVETLRAGILKREVWTKPHLSIGVLAHNQTDQTIPTKSNQVTALHVTMAFPKTYRAYQYENYGLLENELKIHDNVPQKALGAQQVRIKVRSAAVNPIDYVLLEGLGQAFTGKTPSEMEPFNIGFDASGEIVEVGSDVKRLEVGDAVYTSTPFSAFGTLGGYAVVGEEFVAAKPSNLDFNTAAAVPSVALTAYAGM
ncbi:unnamed protein product [Phytophthora fragariaefolia]|uniref:Unnamed protein product n=1 Tax=Phytophthora fragariaefolia TaxID=1490495 RepID=A0A9W6XNU5_9STRA|nr:unnamed protein product [Phytophthora fragariaefolia]